MGQKFARQFCEDSSCDFWFNLSLYVQCNARLMVEVCNKCVEVLMASVSKWWYRGKCSAGVRKKTAAQRLRGAHCTRQSLLSVGLWSHTRADVSCAAPRKNIWSQRQKIFTPVSCASEAHGHRTWLCLMWCSRWSGIHDNWKVRASSFLYSQCQNSILTPY